MRIALLMIVAVIFGCLCDTTRAQDALASCRAIQDPKERLACFDLLAQPKAVVPPDQSKQTPGYRAGYAEALKKTFLSSGLDLQVGAFETQPKGINDRGRKYPELWIFGYLSRPLVYRIITETRILKQAKDFGFIIVNFDAKSPGPTWYFDLSGPDVPTCDQRKDICI